MKRSSEDEDLDAMSGYSEPQTTFEDISSQLNLIELKIDEIRNEVRIVGIGVVLLALIICFK